MEKSYISAGALLDTWSGHEWTNGLQIDRMRDLETLTVKTENSTYEITILCGHKGEVLVRGGKFFPEFTRAQLAGCSLGGSFLKMRGVYIDFKMEFYWYQKRIITSYVQSIDVGTKLQTADHIQ